MGLQKLASSLLGIWSAKSIVRIAARGSGASIAVGATMLVMKALRQNLFYLGSYCFQLYNEADQNFNNLTT